MGVLEKIPMLPLIVAILSSSQVCYAQNSPQDYLDAHNAPRSQVGVGPMTWDDFVAAYALNYVNGTLKENCQLVHSTVGGENLAMSSADLTGTDAVKLWVDEKQYYDYNSNTCAGGECAHYTQVVWNNSVRLGCARVRCNSGGFIISCNYDPPGNHVGQRPYTLGTTAVSESPQPQPPLVSRHSPPTHHPPPPAKTISKSPQPQPPLVVRHSPPTHHPPPPAKTTNHWTWEKKVILGVTGVVIVGLLIVFCFICKLSRCRENFWLTTQSNQDIEAFLKSHGALTLKRYKFSDLKKMTNSFEVKLGQGGFGAVYKGKLHNGSSVAVKMLNSSKGKGEEFINEVASISRTSHVNVVTLLGFCIEGRKKALIYEFMSNGSLDKFIYKKGHENTPSMTLSWDNLYQIAIGIARGLEYLHRGCNTRILHFDIKPHNILLDENFCPKISDFGLAKLCPMKESIISMSDARGTIGYVAPEVWNRHFGRVSHKSDVYSYGMMLLEIVGGRKNIIAEASQTSEIYFPDWIYRRLEQGTDLGLEEETAVEENEVIKRMIMVGLWCIQTIPNDRPAMSKVVEMLEGNINSLEMPPKPVLSSPIRSTTEPTTTVN